MTQPLYVLIIRRGFWELIVICNDVNTNVYDTYLSNPIKGKSRNAHSGLRASTEYTLDYKVSPKIGLPYVPVHGDTLPVCNFGPGLPIRHSESLGQVEIKHHGL